MDVCVLVCVLGIVLIYATYIQMDKAECFIYVFNPLPVSVGVCRECLLNLFISVRQKAHLNNQYSTTVLFFFVFFPWRWLSDRKVLLNNHWQRFVPENENPSKERISQLNSAQPVLYTLKACVVRTGYVPLLRHMHHLSANNLCLCVVYCNTYTISIYFPVACMCLHYLICCA